MMSPDTVERGALEGDIGMMVRLINLVHQRRSLGGSGRARAMTSRAMSGKFGFTGLKLGGCNARGWRWGALGC